MIGSERQNAVVAPVSFAGKIIDRHQLDRRDAEVLQLRKLGLHAGKAAEQARMKLIEDRFVPGPSAPFRMAPAIGARIDHDAWIMDVVGLRARCRIRHREIGAKSVAIARARAACDFRLEPSARTPLHRPGLAAVDLDRHALSCRSPQAKARAVLAEQRCAEWKITHERRHGYSAL